MGRRVARTPVLPSGLPKLDPALGPLNRTLYQSLIDHSNRLNEGMQKDGSERARAPIPLAQVALADLPAASEWPGALLYVTDGGPGGTPALMSSDGSTWSPLTSIGNSALQPDQNLADVDSAATSFDNIKQPATDSYTGVVELATATEILELADVERVITLSALLDSLGFVSLTYASPTVSIDWTDGGMRTLVLSGDTKLGNPTNAIPGTFMTIYVSGSNTTNRTLTFDTNYGGTIPSLTDIDDTQTYVITILCITTSHFVVTAIDGSPP